MSGPNFDFSRLQLSARTAKLTIYQLEHEPYLICTHAGESNKPFFNSVLKRQRQNMKRMRSGAVNAAVLEEGREEDKKLYPKYIIKGWGCKAGEGFVIDSSGNKIEYSQENVESLFDSMPSWLFDQVRIFCNDETNFIPDDADPAPDPEDVAKN